MSALRWETADRFCQVSLQKDLLGGLSVLCIWGSRRNKRGNHKLIPCEDLAAVRKTVRRIGKERRRHGYTFSRRRSQARTESVSEL